MTRGLVLWWTLVAAVCVVAQLAYPQPAPRQPAVQAAPAPILVSRWDVPLDPPVLTPVVLPRAGEEPPEDQYVQEMHELVAGPPWTAAHVHDRLSWASGRAACIVRYEIGGYGYDPHVRGSQGEIGAAQLHPRGLLPSFYARGYTDAVSPYQAIDFLESEIRAGNGYHWAPVLHGMC